MVVFKNYKKGFTLVELLIVIAIIAILAGLILANYQEARKQSRDEKRKIDIEQIALALRLYVEKNGQTVTCIDGMKIDGSTNIVTLDGGAQPDCSADDGPNIMDHLNSYFGGNIPHDPLGPNNNDYYYYFDSFHTCQPAAVPMVFAVNLESSPTNLYKVCAAPGGPGGNDGGLKNTTGPGIGGTINPSAPYVKILDFII